MSDLRLYTANTLTLGVTTFTNIEMGLKVILLLLSIGYTLSKWLNIKKEK
jgi:hypothetical protein